MSKVNWKVRFGVNVRRCRMAVGLSQEQLAARIEPNVRGEPTHHNYIGEIERGKGNPSLAKIINLARALGVPVRELLDGIQ